MDKNNVKPQFGYLPPQYNFSLNPYPELRFSKCPVCEEKTGQRKLPLLIHVDPKNLIALNRIPNIGECHRLAILD